MLVPDPETAETVQQLFGMMADGVSQKRAAQELGLNATTVLWWRYNPLYIGLVYKYRKKVTPSRPLTLRPVGPSHRPRTATGSSRAGTSRSSTRRPGTSYKRATVAGRVRVPRDVGQAPR